MSETHRVTETIEQAAADARLAAIVSSSDDAMVSKTLEGKILTWNAAAERIFGYSASEAIGKSILMLLPEDRKDEEAEILARLRRGERIDHFETIRQRKDGSFVNVSVTISPIYNSEGEVVGASKVARDIDERIDAEIAKARLAAIVESSEDAIVSKTLEGIIETWNQGAERLFGYSAKEAIGKPITILLPDDRLDEETGILLRIRAGERVPHFETIRRRKDGSFVEVSVTVSPIRSEIGQIVGASKAARDITKQKETERALQTLNEELETRVRERTSALQAANDEMEGFTYSVSHDLRGPLRGLIGSSMILMEDFGQHLPDEAKHLIDRQVYAAQKVAQLVDDLLKLSRIGRTKFTKRRVSLTAVATDVASELAQVCPSATFDIEDGLDVQADPELLRLLLLNLMGNACKFSNETPAVTVGREDKWLFVRDKGIGFDMKYSHKLFIAFERLVREDQFPGTGIGLANVKRIVDRHGGQIRAESKPGEGSTFYFTLSE